MHKDHFATIPDVPEKEKEIDNMFTTQYTGRCPYCNSANLKKISKRNKHKVKIKCKDCGKHFKVPAPR